MVNDLLWTLVDAARAASGPDDDRFLRRLHHDLIALDPDDLVGFDVQMDAALAAAYRNELWAAAYVINAGCSDDGFVYFRAWLIAQGRHVYNAAMEDPETLVGSIVMDDAWEAELEDFLYSARRAYLELAGQDMPQRPYTAPTLTGPEWREGDVLATYPALAARSEHRWR
ncbi:MAG: DUF4240 domain-containing protein [Myxococcales bacterium]|nr:DUF4240 domain-containing protein [Myxococcales bacterium]